MSFGSKGQKKASVKQAPHSTGKEHSKLQTLKAARISGLWPKGQKNASVNRTAFNWTRALETLLTLIVNSRKTNATSENEKWGSWKNVTAFVGGQFRAFGPKANKICRVNRIPFNRTRALETLKGARLVAGEQSARERGRDGDRARARPIERDREQRK